jgi:hypothetical protein
VLKIEGKNINPSAPINLINVDYWIAFELSLFATSNIRRKVCGVLDSFLSF